MSQENFTGTRPTGTRRSPRRRARYIRRRRRARACLLTAVMLAVVAAYAGGCMAPAPDGDSLPPAAVQTPQPAQPVQTASEEPQPAPSGGGTGPDGAAEPVEPVEPVEAVEPDILPSGTSFSFTQEEFDQAVGDVLDAIITEDMTAMEQARAVFDYTRNNIRYTGSSDKSDWMEGAYEGLTAAGGDCFTYYAVSRALLTGLGIDNLPVEREGGQTRHYWNLVNCGDGWYHFDACPRSNRLPSFLSFMVTDQQVADFTAMAGRNYYTFDDSLLPERATEIVTKTRPIPPRTEPEQDPDETQDIPEPEEPALPPEADNDTGLVIAGAPAGTGEAGSEAAGGESGGETGEGEPGGPGQESGVPRDGEEAAD